MKKRRRGEAERMAVHAARTSVSGAVGSAMAVGRARRETERSERGRQRRMGEMKSDVDWVCWALLGCKLKVEKERKERKVREGWVDLLGLLWAAN